MLAKDGQTELPNDRAENARRSYAAVSKLAEGLMAEGHHKAAAECFVAMDKLRTIEQREQALKN